MIEREVVVPSERRLVAAVIYNRLHERMPIGIDAALRYGLHIPPTQSITRAALRSNSPYNVRKFTGLPPTPIGNPGLASIQAAAHPAHVPYIYYARKKDKRHHFFTASYAAFQQFLAENGYG
jgi:cell division protein YceG involved in septum cleavage